jgi:hypothetical protein
MLTASSASAARGSCVDGPNGHAQSQLGPLSWLGELDQYSDWDGVWKPDPESDVFYAKNPMYLKRGQVVSMAIAPRARNVADFNYGFRARDVVRLSGCRNTTAFFAGGILVTEPACVPIAVRVRGSRRVYRETVSIGKGDAC